MHDLQDEALGRPTACFNPRAPGGARFHPLAPESAVGLQRFNPRAPGGARSLGLTSSSINNRAIRFQSTRPRRGAIPASLVTGT